MYRSFEIRNFRCFRKLTLTHLERINLIAGVNNVGKTALLEALFLHCGAYNPELTLRINAFRGIDTIKVERGRWTETPWDSLFSGFDVSQNVEMEGENDITRRRLLRLRVIRQPQELAKFGQFVERNTDNSESLVIQSKVVDTVLELAYQQEGQDGRYHMILDPKGLRTEPIPPPPPFPAFFVAARTRVSPQEDAERFGRLEIAGQQDVLVEALRVIEPQLRRLAVVVASGVPMIHGDIGIGRLLPLPLMGDGMARIASLVLTIGNAPGGVVLVDEFENGLHHSIMPDVWRVIGEVARQFNTQVFATTHSLECITAAHKAFTQSETYDFLLHRLERRGELIRVATYDQETLGAALETGLEVR
jgi:predicted ATPase